MWSKDKISVTGHTEFWSYLKCGNLGSLKQLWDGVSSPMWVHDLWRQVTEDWFLFAFIGRFFFSFCDLQTLLKSTCRRITTRVLPRSRVQVPEPHLLEIMMQADGMRSTVSNLYSLF